MKYILLFFIVSYQALLSPFMHAISGGTSGCRYQPTCSVYAYQVIKKYGAKKGSVLAARRLMSCHPFAKDKKASYNTTT